MTDQTVPDPAERLTDDFLHSMWRRYSGGIEAIPPAAPIELDDYNQRFAHVCDAVVQLLWPERYGTDPEDEFEHTSDPARTIARIVLDAAGIYLENDPRHA